MIQLIKFTKKEFMEICRTGKFYILLALFFLFGVMNPAIAKLTPWMMEQLSDSLEQSGIAVVNTEVNALTSWTQFYKNVPMALIIFLLMFSGVVATELQRGTLINMLTKGLSRKNVIFAKTIMLIAVWTICYFMCFGVTYAYNAYFWDNSIADHLFFSVFLIYLFGCWLISLVIMLSGFVSSGSGVAVGTGGVFFAIYLVSMVPKLSRYLPVKLMEAQNLLQGQAEVSDFVPGIVITLVLIVVQSIIGVMAFNKKNI